MEPQKLDLRTRAVMQVRLSVCPPMSTRLPQKSRRIDRQPRRPGSERPRPASRVSLRPHEERGGEAAADVVRPQAVTRGMSSPVLKGNSAGACTVQTPSRWSRQNGCSGWSGLPWRPELAQQGGQFGLRLGVRNLGLPCCHRLSAYSASSGLCGARWSPPCRQVFRSSNGVRMASVVMGHRRSAWPPLSPTATRSKCLGEQIEPVLLRRAVEPTWQVQPGWPGADWPPHSASCPASGTGARIPSRCASARARRPPRQRRTRVDRSSGSPSTGPGPSATA